MKTKIHRPLCTIEYHSKRTFSYSFIMLVVLHWIYWWRYEIMLNRTQWPMDYYFHMLPGWDQGNCKGAQQSYSLHWKSKKSRQPILTQKNMPHFFSHFYFHFNQLFSANKLWKLEYFKIISTCCLACPTRSVLRRSRSLIGSADLISIYSLVRTIHLYAVNQLVKKFIEHQKRQLN